MSISKFRMDNILRPLHLSSISALNLTTHEKKLIVKSS